MRYTTEEEAEELAKLILGCEENVEEKLIEEYCIDFIILESLVDKIIPLLHLGISPLTNKTFIGIVDPKKSAWIVKREFEDMPDTVVAWLTEGEVLPKDKKFLKEITLGGVPEYDIIIAHSKQE